MNRHGGLSRSVLREHGSKDEAHPQAQAFWLCALNMFYEKKGDKRAARECVNTAKIFTTPVC